MVCSAAPSRSLVGSSVSMTERPLRLLLIPGSLDRDDVTNRLLGATTTMVGPFAEIRWATVATLPFYDSSAQVDSAVRRLLRESAEADAILFGVPEHNGAPAARAKNSMDWLTTTPTGKPVGIAAAQSIVRDPRLLRSSLLRAGLGLIDPLIQTPDDDAFDEGLLIDPVVRRSLATLLDLLAASTRID